jgi:hypothetical protein
MTMATTPQMIGAMSARSIMAAPSAVIFSFLTDLENQCLLADDHTQPLMLDGPPGARHSATLRIRGPLGLRRRARARIVATAEPSHVITTVALGRTVVRLRWTLSPLPASTGVELTAEIPALGLLDRALLAAGGRRTIARRLHTALATLAEIVRVASAKSELKDARDCPLVLASYARRSACLAPDALAVDRATAHELVARATPL